MLARGYTILFCFVAQSLVAQSGLPDTLQQKMKGLAQDTGYVNKLNSAAFEYLKTDPAISRSICTYSIDVASRLKYTKGYARSLTVMGNTYWYEGVYEFAQNYYLLAARQYQLIHDSTGLGETFNNIGEVYKRLNDHNKALEYLNRAAGIIRNDSARRALILYNIGESYVQLNQLKQAKNYINQSYRMAIQIKNKRIIAYDYWTLGDISLREKNYESALAYYYDAEKIWKETGETRSLIQTYQQIAEVYLSKRDYTQSERYLKQSIALASAIKVPDLQVRNYLRYSHLDSLRGDFRQALIHLSKHNALKDSVYNILKAEQIARLQTIYETESRDLENQQLKNDKKMRDEQIKSQRITLIAISAGLLLTGVLTVILYRQRKKILFQKNAIEIQAEALLKLNTELQELNKTLEARIEERTQQLTLQNKRITEYTFINAHKLRSPVASILGLINLLEQKNIDDRESILKHLKTCGEQLDKVIHEVSRDLEEAIVNESGSKL